MKTHRNVIYRIAKDNQEVIAFFPEEPGNRNPSTCSIYTRHEQHGHASIDYYREQTTPAAPTQYADLHKELQRIENTHGENRPIKPRKRFHRSYHLQRAQLATA